METNWDPAKARANLARHGVAFEDAELALSAWRGDGVRLISARPATRREKEAYAQGI